MGAEQAAYALNLLKPKFAVGCHYNTWNGMPPGRLEDLEKETGAIQDQHANYQAENPAKTLT